MTAAPPARLPAGVLAESPYLGSKTFGPEENDEPYLLRLGLPVTAEMIITALYCYRTLGPGDLDDGLWSHAAIEITHRGIDETHACAHRIRHCEDLGHLAFPEWLALCRRKVAALLGPAWQAAPCRCPCGYATDDPAAFAQHLDPSRRRSGHRLVTGTQTLAELWEQHPTAARAN